MAEVQETRHLTEPPAQAKTVYELVSDVYDIDDHGAGGHLHIVLEDGNTATHHVEWCRDRAKEEGCLACFALSERLLEMAQDERDILWDRRWEPPALDTSPEGVQPSPFRVFDTNEDLQQAMAECARQMQLAVEHYGLDVAVVTLGGVTRQGQRSLGTLSLGAPLETFEAAEHIVKGVVVSLKALGPSEGTALILPRGVSRGRAN